MQHKEMTSPFDGDHFTNFACSVCKIRPSDLNYIADGIFCPRCATPTKGEVQTKDMDIKDKNYDKLHLTSRYVQLNDDARIILDYSNAVDEFLCGK